MIVYDADSATYEEQARRECRGRKSRLVYRPAGADGNYKTNLWT
jgi:hypothetical protein